MKPSRWLLLFLAALTILRWLLASALPLAPDEAYYLLWSKNLAICYFSKGPGVALAIRAGTMLFGDNPFGIRFFSPLLSFGTSGFVFFLTRRVFPGWGVVSSESIAIWAVILLNATPIFQVGSVLMTIDPLSIFFWAAALWTFWLALERTGRFSFYWPVTGLLIGFGFLCKYTNAMELLSVLLLLAFTKNYRRELARTGFWSMLLAFSACALPPLLWNARHGWVTMLHLRARGHLDTPFTIRPLEALSFIGAHFAVYSPLIFAGLLIALWAGRNEVRNGDATPFLLWFGLPLAILYVVLSLRKAGQPNWTAPAFISLGIFTVAVWHNAARERKSLGGFAVMALAIGICMGLAISDMDAAWRLTAGPRALLPGRLAASYPYGMDPSARLRGWETISHAVGNLRDHFADASGRRPFLIANNYGAASEIAFSLPLSSPVKPWAPPVYTPETPEPDSQYSFWPSYYSSPNPGALGDGDALYVTDRESFPPASICKSFSSISQVAFYQVERHQQPLRAIRVFACAHRAPSGL